jgi:hypothetical protein
MYTSRMNRPFPGAYWVEPAHIAAGEYPGADGRIAALMAHKIGGFIDLTADTGLRGYAEDAARLAAAQGRDVLHRRFAIQDMGVPAVETMRAILDTIDAWRAAGRPLYVHCHAGIGRTGMVIACHLVRRGLAPADALAELGRLRQGSRYAHVPSPETEAQGEFVAQWRRAG